MNLQDEIAKDIVMRIAAQQEKVIQEAVEKYTGEPFDMTMDGSRLRMLQRENMRVMYCDETPILEIHDTEMRGAEPTGDPYHITYVQRYRVLV